MIPAWCQHEQGRARARLRQGVRERRPRDAAGGDRGRLRAARLGVHARACRNEAELLEELFRSPCARESERALRK